MRKIVSLYQRDHDGDRLVRDEVTPGAEWVLTGEGVATRKWDGTCVLIESGKLFARYEVKKGKTPPTNFTPATEVDEVTGKQQGWVPVGDGPDHQWHREAFNILNAAGASSFLADGTYELCGPKVQNNPDGFEAHVLVRHGVQKLDVPRDYESLREFFIANDVEGIVWHHEDGRMVKVKGKDFGIKRGGR